MTRNILLFILMIVIIIFTLYIQNYAGYNKDPSIIQLLCHLFIDFFYGYGLGSFFGSFANKNK